MKSITQKEWQTLPEQAQQEVVDFFKFIQQRYSQKNDISKNQVPEVSVYSNHTANLIDDWLKDEEDEVWK